jgi:hypothetical protein
VKDRSARPLRARRVETFVVAGEDLGREGDPEPIVLVLPGVSVLADRRGRSTPGGQVFERRAEIALGQIEDSSRSERTASHEPIGRCQGEDAKAAKKASAWYRMFSRTA